MNHPDTLHNGAHVAVADERRTHTRRELPAVVVAIGEASETPRIVRSRILNLSVSGAKLCSESPIHSDRLWVAFGAERRMIVEAEVIWSAPNTGNAQELVYGVSFTRVLSEVEFERLVDALSAQNDDPQHLAPSIRDREESLFALFRGHTPQGARTRIRV